MEIKIDSCKHCGKGFTFDSESVPRYRVDAAPLVIVYVLDCVNCGRQVSIDIEQSYDEFLQEMKESEVPDGMKRCPDCAEFVQEMARVCRFCTYRFGEDN
ncbi:MAG: hypothetical protein FI725_06535 [SAR202 cluster bacterium]|nr:hypothetical protein [SAR202 cluster bacterium]|tara:strand:+ start:529 stop:828 length:300 start_codon:yes stop_codon:yes gene_type:complete